MNKKFYTILLLATLLAGTFGIFASTANAQTAPSQKTYAIADAIPNTIGLGESTLLKCGITEALESADLGWTGITIKVVAPDGTSQTLGPFKTDSTGSTFTQYTPTQVGNYTTTTYFPQQAQPTTFFNMERGSMTFAGTIMLASNKTFTFQVTEEPSKQYPGHALPTEYWTRPIDPQLREWFSISGNWVTRSDNAIAPFNEDAPETAHVLWAKDLTTGGLTGGLLADVTASSESGDAYEGKFQNSVILNGILYYNVAPPVGVYSAALDVTGVKAVDLHTGQELWFKNNTSISFGQTLYWNSYNVDGVYTYLVTNTGTEWIFWDPFNGEWSFTFQNVPSGAATVRGPSGEILIYQIDYVANRMMLWNSTLCGLQTAARGTPDMGSWASNIHQKTVDASNPLCYSWNVSIPAGLTASTSFFAPILKVYDNDRVVSIFFNQTKVRVWALDISDLGPSSTSTTKLFDEWWSAPSEWLDGANTLHYVGASDYVTDSVYGEGVIGIWDKELTTHYGFSVENGKYLWATESENYLDFYGWGNAEHTWYYAYGNLYSVGVGGILYAYDLASGTTKWTYNLTDAYGEPVTGENWWGWITLIADGKIYLGTLEHSAENPLPRGAPQVCINATDGSEIWRINGMFRDTRWGGNGVIGDSIIATMDTYDQRIYAIGKGPTAMTIDVPGAGLASGQSVMIRGVVTDTSPGLSAFAATSRFPNGVPAVSDASMSDWMLYVWKQFEKPTTATGVTVAINVVDANGNYRTIGTTTSDANGQYAFAWTPDISGTYYVISSFAGSKSYYGSFAESAFVVDEPVATATPMPTPAPSAADLYFLPGIIGVIITVIVVGAVLLIALRKRP
jgi:hypothetical protein